MRALPIALGLVAGIAAGPSLAAPSPTISIKPVRIDTGLVSGAPGRDSSVSVYKGIPYAAPPVGELRWRPPAPAKPWSGVRKADSFGPNCPQPTAEAGMPVAEDCLTLNIWTAAKSKTERRAVLVWLPVFLGGSAANPEFDGENLARKGIVFVSLNYRAGPLGFLATPELSQESGHNASGNYGVMDQVAALEWVRRNIAAFGGDPKRVTIAGMDSQRGSSTNYLAMSPQAKGLFERATSQSQFPIPSVLDPPRPMANTLKAAEAQGQAYVESRGVHSMAELRALPLDKLMQGPEAGGPAVRGSNTPRRVYEPIVDGWVVPMWYNDFAAGQHRADVAYMAGNNANEGGAQPEANAAQARAAGPDLRGRAEPKLTAAAYLDWAKQKFGAQADAFLKLYPASTDAEAAHENTLIVQDYARVATYIWGVQWGLAASKPTFTYFWTHPSPPMQPGGTPSAGHGAEIAFAFDNLDLTKRPWTDEDRKVAKIASSYWVNLVKNGDPNGPGLPVWPKLEASTAQVMELGDHMGPIPLASPEKVDFWRKVYLNQQAPARRGPPPGGGGGRGPGGPGGPPGGGRGPGGPGGPNPSAPTQSAPTPPASNP